MPDVAELALKNLERVLSKDPMLRDVLEQSLPKSKRGGKFSPDVDVLDCGDKYAVFVDLPGVTKNDVHVELQGMKLIVHGVRTNRHPETGSPVACERQSGPFKRVFLMPSQVLSSGVTADLTDGVLSIEIPKSGPSGRTTIPIK
jgi:HSP20 family protein